MMWRDYLMGKKKILVFGILVILVVIIIISYKSVPSVKTIEVVRTDYEDKISFKGLYFTQEYVLYNGEVTPGDLKVKDGVKVPKGVNIYQNIYSSEAGVVSTHIDGYENKFDIDNVSKVGEKVIEKISEKDIKPGIKIVNNSTWFIYAMIDKAFSIKKKTSYMLSIDNAEYPADVVKLENKQEGNFIIFRVNYDLNILNLHRNINGYIIKSRYNGIVIPTKALYSIDGKQGVLIKAHGYAEFRRVKLLFENEETAVILPADKGKKLEEYDEIIFNSQGLREGTKIR
jgi:hypothetical protein